MEPKPYLTFVGCNVDQFISAVETILGYDAADTVFDVIVRRNNESDIVVLEPTVLIGHIEGLSWISVKSTVGAIAEMYELPDIWYVFTVDSLGKLRWSR